jgi:hypothetical protein
MKSTKAIGFVLAATAVTSLAILAYAQKPTANNSIRDEKQTNTCPMMEADNSKASRDADSHARHAGVNMRGEKAMGFSQSATTHHFLLMPDGGAIQVEVNNPEDSVNREEIRAHLKHISQMFSNGNFEIPLLVHDQVPPGVPVMQELKAEISYTFEETQKGARVRISTQNPKALAAIHDFLRFQIQDHGTSDPLQVNSQ